MTEFVKARVSGGVMEIVLARPAKKNALNAPMYQAIIDALKAGDADPGVHAILFTGEGDLFTAGNDMEDFAKTAAGTGEPKAVAFMEAIATTTKPVVAAVHGHAVGIGTTMLLHCDLVVIADDAKLTAPFMKLGIVPEAGSSLLMPTYIGHVKAFAMFALGQPVVGAAAVAMGLANVALPKDQVVTAARKMCADLALTPPGALKAGKALMRDQDMLVRLIRKEAAVLAECVRSPEAREVFAAFLERRPPDFAKIRATAAAE
jgi:enoyl-CoA hydratase/carnithine racemase